MQTLWTEKYRPKKLEELVGQEHVTRRLKTFIAKSSLPHCLFAGPAGVGKTTACLCLAREFFGEAWRSNILELNSSDERGIETIRIKVKDFARIIPLNASFKIIHLDEADSLTKDAQHALRRTMEKYSRTARFILTANYSNKIIEPIQSRTAVFRFSSLKKEDINTYLKKIAAFEGLELTEEALEAIQQLSEGDLRKAVNILQTSAIENKITKEHVFTSAATHPKLVKDMLSAANFTDARSILAYLLREKGMSGEDILREMFKQLSESAETNTAVMEKLAEAEFRIVEGADPLIQISAVLAAIKV
jgi:replication factor C small subunit